MQLARYLLVLNLLYPVEQVCEDARNKPSLHKVNALPSASESAVTARQCWQQSERSFEEELNHHDQRSQEVSDASVKHRG